MEENQVRQEKRPKKAYIILTAFIAILYIACTVAVITVLNTSDLANGKDDALGIVLSTLFGYIFIGIPAGAIGLILSVICLIKSILECKKFGGAIGKIITYFIFTVYPIIIILLPYLVGLL